MKFLLYFYVNLIFLFHISASKQDEALHEFHDDLLIRNHHKNEIASNDASLVAERLLAYLTNIARPGLISPEYAHHVLNLSSCFRK